VDNATKHQLKKQDKFVAVTTEGIQWAEHHRQKFIIAIVVAVVVIVGAVGGYTLYSNRSSQAATDFGAAMQTYNTPLASSTQPLAPGTKTFPDAKARAIEANKEFATIASKYGLTQSGKLAEYFVGLTAMEAGQNGPAEDALKKVASSWDSGMAALGKMALAQLYQQTNQDAKAIDLYNELAKGSAMTVSPGMAQLQLAELYQSEGKTEQARKIYAEIKDKDKDAKGKPGAASEIASEKLNPKSSK